MAELKYDLSLVSTLSDKKIQPQAWYKERLRTKHIKSLKPTDTSKCLVGRNWVFLKDGLDDFRDGLPPAVEGDIFIKAEKGPGPNLTGSSENVSPVKQPAVRNRFNKYQVCFSQITPQQQQRREHIEEIEYGLLQHPLALYPHLEESVPPEVFLATGKMKLLALVCFDDSFIFDFDEELKKSRTAFIEWFNVNFKDLPTQDRISENQEMFTESSTNETDTISDTKEDLQTTDDDITQKTEAVESFQVKLKAISVHHVTSDGLPVLVHISNLIHPVNEFKVRELNLKHVKILQKEFLKSAGFTPMAMLANMPNIERNAITVEDLKQEGKFSIQVIGGNHTLAALKALNWSGCLPVYLYCNLPTDDCLKLGLLHNLVHETSRHTTFEEYVLLFRRFYEDEVGAPHHEMMKKMKLRVSSILDIEAKNIRNRFKVCLNLAPQPEAVWEALTLLFKKWKAGEIVGANYELTQSVFVNFYRLKSVDIRLDTIQKLNDGRISVQQFKKICSGTTECRKRRCEEGEVQTVNQEIFLRANDNSPPQIDDTLVSTEEDLVERQAEPNEEEGQRDEEVGQGICGKDLQMQELVQQQEKEIQRLEEINIKNEVRIVKLQEKLCDSRKTLQDVREELEEERLRASNAMEVLSRKEKQLQEVLKEHETETQVSVEDRNNDSSTYEQVNHKETGEVVESEVAKEYESEKDSSSNLFEDIVDILDPEMNMGSEDGSLDEVPEDSESNPSVQEEDLPKSTEPTTTERVDTDLEDGVVRNPYRWLPRKEEKKDKRKANEKRSSSPSQEEHITNVTQDFCNWVASLGGESNNIEESTITSLFASGYETKPALSVPIHVVELTNVPQELRMSAAAPPQQQVNKNLPQAKEAEKRWLYSGTYEPSWIKFKYGAWYLNPKSWERRQWDDPLIDPKELKNQEMSEAKKKSHDLNLELSQMHGSNAFMEFIDKKSTRKPEFLEQVGDIQREQAEEEQKRIEAELLAKQKRTSVRRKSSAKT